ncbi:MAG TPA: hypothetical protein VJT33_07055 [bacterium]|nr:hypothetical protein [bacterium]
MRRMNHTIAIVMLLSLVVLGGTAYAQYNYGSPATPQPAPPTQSTAGSFTVAIGTGTVNSKPTKILVDVKGMSLYSLSSDKGSTSACAGACAQAWPPLLSAKPTASTSLPGKLTMLRTANGTQVAYNGHLLYRFSGDTKPGQANGDDQKGPAGGEWYVAMPSMKAAP